MRVVDWEIARKQIVGFRMRFCPLQVGMFFNYLSISVNILHVSVHPNVYEQIFVYSYQYISVSVNTSSINADMLICGDDERAQKHIAYSAHTRQYWPDCGMQQHNTETSLARWKPVFLIVQPFVFLCNHFLTTA